MIRFAIGCALFLSATVSAADLAVSQQVSPFAVNNKTSSVTDLPLPGGFAGSGNNSSPQQSFDFSTIEVIFIRAGLAGLRVPIKDSAADVSGNIGVVRYRAMEIADGQKMWIGGRQLHTRVYSDRVTLSFVCSGISECGIAWEGELSAPAYYFARPSVGQKTEVGAKNPATLPSVGITWGGTQGRATNQSASQSAP